jgi:hypothetical protein
MVLRRDLYIYSVGGVLDGVDSVGALKGAQNTCTRPHGGVPSSPVQLWEGEIKGYTIELPARLEKALFDTTKLF